MDLSVKLDVFEGPLDLLLHLIDKNKLDIYDIPIAEVTQQYLAYVRQMDQEDLDRTSEFLVMAATLLDIKARMLLPREETAEEEEDPRAGLVERLLEYRKFKYLASDMRELEAGSEKLFYREQELPEEVARYRVPVNLDGLLKGLDSERLRRIFEEVLRRSQDKVDPVRSRFGAIERETVHIGDRLDHVRSVVKAPGRHSFRSLLNSGAGKLEIVVTFMAILELIKNGEIRLTQDSTRDDFNLEYAAPGTAAEKAGEEQA